MIKIKIWLLKNLALLKDMQNDAFSSVDASLWYIMRALAIVGAIWITYTVGSSLGYLVLTLGVTLTIVMIYSFFTQRES